MVKPSVEQINYAMVAKPHTPMYLMHKYWARKPHNVVAEYISHYSKKGDIVLDPFCGSGVTPIEAVKMDRKGIGIDLDPMATLITRITAAPADISRIKSTFEDIKKSCKERIESLYKTICPKCKGEAIIVYVIKRDEIPIEIGYDCRLCPNSKNSSKRFLKKKPDDFDFRLIRKIEKMKIPYWTPKDVRLYYDGSKFMKGESNETIGDLYDKRALIALSMLYNEIDKIRDENVKSIFKLIFTSNVHNVSKLNPVHQPRWKAGMHPSTSWIVHSYWVPPLRVECPVWFYFEERFNHVTEGKIDSNSKIKCYREARKFDDLNDGANFFVKELNALELSDVVPANSVDYIFTDPPYGGAIQYFELSTLWASWLKMGLDFKDEITINGRQDKDFEYYHKMLRAAFKEMYKVLKPGRYMTVTFHSTDIKVWNSIIKAVAMVGFELEKIIYQPPARPSAKGLLQPYGSAVGDYYIRFIKPVGEKLRTERDIDLNTYELEVVDAAQRIIGERGEPTIYQHILNGIMVELRGGRSVPSGAKNIDKVLGEHVGKEFELIDVHDEKGRKIGKKWWLKGVDIIHFNKPTLSDRVERSVVNLLNRSVKVSFDEVLQAIFIEYPNALTPEAERIKDILGQYAEKTDGKWRLKPSVKFAISQHSRMIALLAKIGENLGYDIWIGLKEQSGLYDKRRLSDFITEKRPRWRFVKTTDWDRVDMIDVVWHEQGRIRFEFEIENTTAVTDAISRGSVIPSSHLKRVIVIPKERETLIYRKMREPMVAENIEKFEWKFLFYDDVENLSKRRNATIDDMEKLFKLPKEARQTQNSINDFSGQSI